MYSFDLYIYRKSFCEFGPRTFERRLNLSRIIVPMYGLPARYQQS